MAPQYKVVTKVDGRVIDTHDVPDPLIHTTVHVDVRDLLKALLRRRLTVEVAVTADLKTIRAIMEIPHLTEEWAVRVDEPHPGRGEKAGDILTHFGEEKSRRAGEVWHGWTPIVRTVGRWLVANRGPSAHDGASL